MADELYTLKKQLADLKKLKLKLKSPNSAQILRPSMNIRSKSQISRSQGQKNAKR